MTLLRTSPAYDAHLAGGAVMREKNRWHRVDWFAPHESIGDPERRPSGPGADRWSPAVEAEHRATRERVGLFDLTSFGKVEVAGRGAAALLEHLCANDVARETGRLVYTQMLNPGGGVVADVTVGRLADDLFLVVTGTSALDHDLRWLVDHVDDLSDEDRASVSVRDVTSAWACFGVWGPLARDVLAPVVEVPLDSAAFPYMGIRAARLADTVPVRMSRVTFVGELGWEVYVPTEYGRSVWELLSDAVAAVGGLRCGYRAIDSLRVEKGYLYLGTELTADRTPVASGLRRYVSGDKEYVGKDHVLQGRTPAEQLVCLTLDGSWVLLDGGEPVLLRDGRASTVTSGGLGYTVGLAVGFAFLPSDVTEGSPVEVLVDGRALEARVARQPLYDPSGSRIRA